MDWQKLGLLLAVAVIAWLCVAHYQSHVKARMQNNIVGGAWATGTPDSLAGDSTNRPQDQVAGNPTM